VDAIGKGLADFLILKISIITVVLNDPSGFCRTADSILNQDYVPVEWIVIDGGSIDNTIASIHDYEKHLTFWVSEPDNGPYDAMNKGLAKATGEWVMFINSGDTFAGPDVLSGIFNDDIFGVDVIYGDWITDYKRFRVLQKAGSPSSLQKGMVFCHQAMAFRTTLARDCGFNQGFPIGADYDMIYNLYVAGSKFRYFQLPFAVVEAFGISHRNMVRSAREHYAILHRYKNLTFKDKINHSMKICFLWLITGTYKVLPMDIMLNVIKFNHRRDLVQLPAGISGFKH
jgi:glycosyltransferase involved in cell wall biosynthesis